MTEVTLFLLVSVIAVVSAVAMLLSPNAVHSALFLILVMGCIAFLFLMLEAPFLFLVQITVYAGAIMVLFLFVIMLLGAERLTVGSSEFRWMTPVAMVLALIFLFATALALGQGGAGELQTPGGNPLVRVAHFAPDAGPVDVYANNELIAEDLAFGQSIGHLQLPPGEYNLALFNAGTDNALTAQTLTLEPGFVGTALAYGDEDIPLMALAQDDLSAIGQDNSTRLTVFNAYTPSEAGVSLVDLRSDLDPNDDVVLVENVPVGELSSAAAFNRNTDPRTWAFVDNSGNVLFRLTDPEAFRLNADTSQLLVLSAGRTFDDSLRAQATALESNILPSFGGPVAIGRELFTRYLLPMQVVAVLLLVAMIGAIVLTHKTDDQPRKRRDERRRVSRPLTSVISAQTGQEVTQAPGNGNGAAKLPEPSAEPQTEG